METSEDESSSTIDFRPEIAVNRYRLTDFIFTLPLYIIHTTLPIFTFTIRSTKRVVSLISCQRGDCV